MQNIDHTLIRQARMMRRLSMQQLASLMGDDRVSRMAISKIERGLIRPSDSTLHAIARACGVPLSYFTPQALDLGHIQYRFDQGTTTTEQQQVKALIHSTIADYLATEAQFPPAHTNTTSARTIGKSKHTLHTFADAEQAALRLRRKWDIGLQPIFSVYELLQQYGIRVLELDFGTMAIDGISAIAGTDTPIIIINTRKNLTTERKRFTALHELAHLLFRLRPLTPKAHADYLAAMPPLPYQATEKCPDTETLCHRFGNAMLLPAPCLYRRIGTTRTTVAIEELVSIRERYGISIAAIVHRLHDLRVIDDYYYHHYFEHVIMPNRLETGWGRFPIDETADTPRLLKIRMEKELGKIGKK